MRSYQEHGLAFLALMNVVGKTVLDVGCGVGWAAIKLQEKGALVTALDILPANHVKFDGIHAKNIPYVASFDGLPVYDYIWCHHTLEHMRDPIEFLLGLREYGRELWIGVPYAPRLAFAKGHIVRYNLTLLIEHLRQAGFDVQHGSFHTSSDNLWAVVRPYAGFAPVENDNLAGYSEYPESMSKMNDYAVNSMSQKFDSWNWPPGGSDV